MANQMTKKQRAEVEEIVYKTFSELDISGENEKYYRELFSKMNDSQFYNFIKRELPFRLHHKPFVVEPTLDDARRALKVLDLPLVEKIYEPHLYRNSEGKPVVTKECLTGYLPLEKVQQFVTKKNKYGADISSRDMKSGRLNSGDKGATMSDREFECLVTVGLSATAKEFEGPRGDAMDSKNMMYNMIGTTGKVSLSDLPSEVDDSLSRNMLNYYMMAANLDTDILNIGDYTRSTIKDKKRAGLSGI